LLKVEKSFITLAHFRPKNNIQNRPGCVRRRLYFVWPGDG